MAKKKDDKIEDGGTSGTKIGASANPQGSTKKRRRRTGSEQATFTIVPGMAAGPESDLPLRASTIAELEILAKEANSSVSDALFGLLFFAMSNNLPIPNNPPETASALKVNIQPGMLTFLNGKTSSGSDADQYIRHVLSRAKARHIPGVDKKLAPKSSKSALSADTAPNT